MREMHPSHPTSFFLSLFVNFLCPLFVGLLSSLRLAPPLCLLHTLSLALCLSLSPPSFARSLARPRPVALASFLTSAGRCGVISVRQSHGTGGTREHKFASWHARTHRRAHACADTNTDTETRSPEGLSTFILARSTMWVILSCMFYHACAVSSVSVPEDALVWRS